MMSSVEKTEIQEIKKSDARYPRLLKEIHDAPDVLYVKGRLPEDDAWTIGIVGTRKPTEYGVLAAKKFAGELAQAGAVIVSGLAYGIDAEAHKAAVKEQGKAVAVIGSGLDYESFYPKDNWRLAEEIVKTNGALISEYPPGTRAEKWHFPERNRIIVGLIQGLILIEARDKSGAQITARLALEENRDVFAVPGSIFSPASHVPNHLIKEGAVPALSPDDILEYYGRTRTTAPKEAPLDPIEAAIIEALEEPRSLDELKRTTNAEITTLQAALSLLELSGRVAETEPGKYQILH